MTDPFRPDGPASPDAPPRSALSRWAWFGGLALAGLLAVAVTAYALRAALFLAG